MNYFTHFLLPKGKTIPNFINTDGVYCIWSYSPFYRLEGIYSYMSTIVFTFWEFSFTESEIILSFINIVIHKFGLWHHLPCIKKYSQVTRYVLWMTSIHILIPKKKLTPALLLLLFHLTDQLLVSINTLTLLLEYPVLDFHRSLQFYRQQKYSYSQSLHP